MSFASVVSRFLPVPMHRVPVRTAQTAGRPTIAFWTFTLGIAALLPAALQAQSPGTLDTTFLSTLSGATVFSVTTQGITSGTAFTDFILAGGDTDMLLVLDPQGAATTTFADPIIGSGNRIVYTIVPEMVIPTGATVPDFLIGGLFGPTELADKTILPKRNIARIDINGVLDTTFDPGKGADDFVTAIVPQANGQILVGGQFLNFNKTPYPRLVLLNHDGSIANSFAPVQLDDSVFAIAAQIDPGTGQPNGQFIVGGAFNTIGNSSYTKLARVDLSGNVDPTFKPVIDSRVLAIAVQPDGKIIIGGQFTTVDGHAAGNIARLNQDGTFDPTFSASVSGTPDNTSDPVAAYVLRLLPDGRLFVGGNFSTVDGVPRAYLARIESDGSLDTGFDPGHSITNSVQSLAIQADNRILVGETVSKKINNVFPPSLIRLYGDPLPVVTLSAPQPVVRRGTLGTARKIGVFEFTRSGGDLSTPLTVYFRISGNAKNGTTIKPLAVEPFLGSVSYVTFPANVDTLSVEVKARNMPVSDSPEKIVLNLQNSPVAEGQYDVGTPSSGKIKIFNAP